MRAATLGRILLPAALVILVACEGRSSTTVDDQRVVVITVSPPTPTVEVGSSIQLSALARDVNSNIVNGASFVWSSFNESVATVESGGLVTGVAVGAAIIDARIPGVSVTAGSASLTVVAAAAAAPAGDR